ncbi:hypothetical protein HYH03_013523 [Edaphochlamys debaryana]|uniref:DNA repair protein RAD50 n=1 Tax=Edaphochlamys debaryana TaxID=47281 RepID=A0A836BUI2_9CHLO|nr:hypothetical protein HYH03_013523 [Edaphochlamys debaryana]|eukprot:KAG2487944.1 hypothetical protein HYH03_013523 [Edaphochlamys debaryana]
MAGCTVEKVMIKGIRSFSPDNTYAIEFYKPLTIIVGSNGAGKTTIIESLRCATTGELPPNTRQGHGFVHDPKVAGDTDVKAQIRLAFSTANGSRIVVTRSFQLTQKGGRGGLQFKTLDAVLSATNRLTGKRESTTYRCADLDKMVPTLMGVSKAVLENVIFVHQEESNWPLAEGKVLKDKFDDIFAATKYTKALEALRKLRTEKGQQLKELRLQLENVKQVKDMAAHHTADRETARARAADCGSQMAALEAQIKDLDSRRSALTARLSELDSLARDSAARRAQLELLRARNRERQERFLAEGREDFVETDEELKAHLAGCDAAAQTRVGRLRALEAEVNTLRISTEALADQYQRDCVRHGKAAGEAATHASNLAERDRAIRAASVALALPLPQGQGAAEGEGAAGGSALSSAAAEAFTAAVGGKVRELESRVTALRADARINDERMSKAVDDATAGVARAQEGLRIKRAQVESNNNAISSAAAQIASSQYTTANLRALQEDAEMAEAIYKRKQADSDASDAPRQADTARGEAEAAARRIAELRSERQRAASAAEVVARLRLKRTELESKQEQMDLLLFSRRRDLARALDLPPEQLPPPDALRRTSDAAVARLKAEEAAHLRASQEAHRAAEAAKASLASRKEELRSARAGLDRLRERLRRGMAEAAAMAPGAAAAAGGAGAGPSSAAAAAAAEEAENDYNNRLEKASQAESKRRTKLSVSQAAGRVFGDFQEEVAGGCSGCPLCQRPWAHEGERTVCLDFLNNTLKDLPGLISEQEEVLSRLQRQVAAYRELQPSWVRFTDLRDKVPGMEADVAQLDKAVEDLTDRSDATQLEYAEACEKAREASKLAAEVVWPLDRMAAEAEGLKREIASAEAASGGSGAGRSVAEVDAEMETVEGVKQRAEAEREAAMARANRVRDEVLQAQRGAMAAQQRAMEAAAAVGKVTELTTKIMELEAANAALEAELRSAAAAVAPQEGERDRLVRQREEARGAAAAEVARAEEQLRDAQLQSAQLAAACRPVAEYEARGRGAELGRLAEGLEALRRRREGEAAALAAKEAELAGVREEESRDEALRRDVADMLELRASRAEAEAMEAEVAQADAAAAAVGDAGELQRQSAALGAEREALRSKVDVLRGHAAAATTSANRAQQELDNPRYKDIGRRFTVQQVTVKTTEMALGDLDKYHKALERALLAFHTAKMSDINRLIKELWQKTYRGQDIDYIQIKADAEGQGARSYNYRVVMYAGAAELEMRGRCSAGQKVLACLIIRLALAETFCLNCGILALDEPTTNLDAANSESLAEALQGLMRSRAGQENFQLIVITHDERFARLIGKREYTDTIWRVTKDPVTQHSTALPEEVEDD